MSKLLTVFGATGYQGGALIDFVLQHPQLSKDYRLRGVTRDVSKPIAVALEEHGVDMVEADMSDPLSLEKAVAGSHAVFAMTNFWDHESADIETTQGINIADTCVSASVSLLIWSSLPNVAKMTSGKLDKVHHFDSKAKVEDYIREHVMSKGVKAVFYMPAWYMSLFQTMAKPRPVRSTASKFAREYFFRSAATGGCFGTSFSGQLIFKQGTDGILTLYNSWGKDNGAPMIDINDTGKYLAPILLAPSLDTYNGATLTAATGYYTSTQLCDVWTRVTGKEVRYVETQPGGASPEGMSDYMKQLLRDMRGLMGDWGYYGPTGPKDLEWTLKQVEAAGEKLTTWEDFVKREGPWW